MKQTVLLLFLSIILGINTLSAQLRVPNFFSSKMVLQRDTVTKFWGWSKPGTKVLIKGSWMDNALEATSTGDAKWEILLPTTKAGGPYQIDITSGNEKIALKDVLMGEVWLCSGQSNMQWGAQNKLQEMIDILPVIANPNIRFLQISNIASATPQQDIYDVWKNCDSASASVVSAIGYFYASELSKKLNVPIGIINASWGGTSADVWTPGDVIENDKELIAKAKLQTLAPRKPNLPGYAFNNMINPYVGYALAGVLWYQGENNVVAWDSYTKLFSGMITSWRTKWNDNFPFYFAQIAPYDYKNKDLPKAAYLREAQTNTTQQMLGVKMVLTSDLVSDLNNIHPIRKKEVAQRFANVALYDNYNLKLSNPYSALYKSFEIKGNQILISFNNTSNNPIVVKDENVEGLYIAAEDQKFYPAKAKFIKDKLVVYNSNIKEPKAVRYAFSETTETKLFTSNGLPVSLFRTDNWLQFTLPK